MTIFQSDLKLVHAVEDSQFDTGGGPLTNREIADGAIGELIDPIDEVAASIGRVYVYKGGAVVDTPTTDRLQNAFLFISETPSDPLISATLTTTKDPFDRVPAIRAHIESYFDAATPWFGYFLGVQSAGLRSLALFQRPGTAMPQVGSTLAIVMDEGLVGEVQEYVVVESVKGELHTVTVGNVEVTKLIVTVSLQDRLANTFVGSQIDRNDPINPRSVLKTTYVAAKAKYYGMTETTAVLAAGDNILHVAAIENQLVPTSTTSTSHVDLRATGDDSTIVPAADGTTLVNSARGLGPGATFYTGIPIYPGTLSVSAGGTSLHDANGILYAGTIAVGTVDYAGGAFTGGAKCPDYNGPTAYTFKAGAVVNAPSQTAKIEVTANNQWTDYAITLPVQPEPGTTRVYYRAQGVDYVLQDRGDGTCVGFDDSFGTAQVRFTTRTVDISLTTLPDVDSFVFVAWGVKSYVYNRSNSALGLGWFEFVTTAALPPGGVSIAWTVNGAPKTATDDGLGNLVGDASGQVFYKENKIWLKPAILPPAGTEFVVTVTPRLKATETFAPIPTQPDGTADIQLANGNLVPGSVRLEFTSALDLTANVTIDETTTPGVVAVPGPHPVDGRFVFYGFGTNAFVGLTSSIYHTTGRVVFSRLWNQAARVPVVTQTFVSDGHGGGYWRSTFTGWSGASHQYEGTACTVSYYYGDPGAAVQETFTASKLIVDVTPGLNEMVLLGSLSFTLGTRRIVDQDGKLYADPASDTGAGTLSGSLDPLKGYAGLTAWEPGIANAPALVSVATRVGIDVVDEVTFRAPGSPVAANSVQITALDTAGNTITATADGSGAITGTGIDGFFYYAAALGAVRFGDWVDAASNTGQPWYHASDVVNGQILKPRQVVATSVRFNCRTINYIPVDASIIKINAARLPKTGKVPTIQKGDWLLIHHTLTTEAATATAGGTLDLGRTGLERVWVRDSTGKKVPDDRYSVSLTTGILTWAAPLSLAGYSAPFTIHNRRMHRSRCTRVDLSGRVDLEFAPDWDIPSGAKVSTGMIIGDLQGRVTSMFTQGAWDVNHAWVDSTPNTTPTAIYNHDEFPVAVSNRSTTDSYAIIFTSPTVYKILSKGRGQLAQDISTATDYTLVNLVTNEPEFTIYHLGFGTGWVPGNVLRIDIEGGKAVWDLALTVQPGNHAITVDRLTLEFAGGV